MVKRILAINPGSTSTKIALYKGRELLFDKNLAHSTQELSTFNDISEQFTFRKNLIINLLSCLFSIDIIPSSPNVNRVKVGLSFGL